MAENKRLVYIALALSLASAGLRYLSFQQSEFATGWDSYFYLVQLQSLENTGRMHSPDASLIYPYFRAWYCMCGDYVEALKWGNAALCGIFTLLACALARDARTGFWLGAWTVFSPHLTYFAAQYPKNLLGMVLFVAFVLAAEKTPKRSGALWIAALFLLNYFGHRLMFGCCVLYVVLLMAARHRVQWRPAWVFAAVAALLLLGFAAGRAPGLAHYVDVQRLSGAFSLVPQFAPWSFASTFGGDRISGWWRMETIVVTVGFFAALPLIHRSAAGICWWAGCLLMLFPFLIWDYQGLSWRLFLVFIPLAPLALREQPFHRLMAWSMPLLLGAALFSWNNYQPGRHDPNYGRYDAVTRQVQAYFTQHAPPELVIAPNALAEYFTFHTGIDAMPWLPEYTIDSTRLWRIAAGPRWENLRYHAGVADSLVVEVGPDHCLLPEYAWQRARIHAQGEGDEYFIASIQNRRNPDRMRPGWLLRRKEQ